MTYLPDEIVEEILFRLPAKCLVGFKCVSKSWLAIISNPNFIKMHLNRSLKNKRILRIFQDKHELFRVDFDSLHDGNDLQTAKIDSFPLTFQFYGLKLRCSCDGLLCMSNGGAIETVDLCDPSTGRNYGPPSSDGLLCMQKVRAIENVFLWNPSTKKHIKLPYATIEITNLVGNLYASVYCLYRIGYDHTNDDYKVVRMVIFIRYPLDVFIDYEVKIYSLKKKSWHRPEKFPHCPDWTSYGNTIVSGALHWISTVKTDLKTERVIVAFDLGTEKYRVLPHLEYTYPKFSLCLDNFEGCLSLSCEYETIPPIVDVFLLKEYGGKNEHWSKLVTFSRKIFFDLFYCPLKPIAYSKCGKKLWLDIGRQTLVLYNLEQKSFEEITVHEYKRGLTGCLHTCIESLVSVE